jgi:hypothetical protein
MTLATALMEQTASKQVIKVKDEKEEENSKKGNKDESNMHVEYFFLINLICLQTILNTSNFK